MPGRYQARVAAEAHYKRRQVGRRERTVEVGSLQPLASTVGHEGFRLAMGWVHCGELQSLGAPVVPFVLSGLLVQDVARSSQWEATQA